MIILVRRKCSIQSFSVSGPQQLLWRVYKAKAEEKTCLVVLLTLAAKKCSVIGPKGRKIKIHPGPFRAPLAANKITPRQDSAKSPMGKIPKNIPVIATFQSTICGFKGYPAISPLVHTAYHTRRRAVAGCMVAGLLSLVFFGVNMAFAKQILHSNKSVRP